MGYYQRYLLKVLFIVSVITFFIELENESYLKSNKLDHFKVACNFGKSSIYTARNRKNKKCIFAKSLKKNNCELQVYLTLILLLSGDIETNPGPNSTKNICPICNKKFKRLTSHIQASHKYDNPISKFNKHSKFNEDKWLDDIYIQTYFDAFQQDINKLRNDVLFFGPCLSQMLRFTNLYEVTQTLTYLNFEKVNFSLFCINNCNENSTSSFSRGSHWSLLLYSKHDKIVYHFDSMKGLNHKPAKDLIENIGLDVHFIEIPVIQQTNGFECGLHVLVNCKFIFSYFLSDIAVLKISELFSLGNCLKNKTLAQENAQPQIDENKFINTEHDFEKRDTVENITDNNITKTNVFKNLTLRGNKKTTSELKQDTVKISPHNFNTKRIQNKLKPTIKILSDSHGRHLSRLLTDKMNDNYTISGVVKPNAKIGSVMDEIEQESKNLNNDDYLLIIGGANDIQFDLDTNLIYKKVKEKVQDISQTKIVLTSIPYRYDIPALNSKIKEVNKHLQSLSYQYSHIQYLSLHNLIPRNYTKYGLHLNNHGKKKLCTLIKRHIKNDYDLKRYKCSIPVHISDRSAFLENPRGIRKKT